MTPIFITGGTGYIGKRLIQQLLAKGHDVTALVRKGSEEKLPPGVRAIIGDPFEATSFQQWIPKGATFIQLLGASPSSYKAKEQLRTVDLQSIKASAEAAQKAEVSHFIFVSTAMTEIGTRKGFCETKKEAEAVLLTKHLPCTVIRPWQVMGPGWLWPMAVSSGYRAAQLVPAWREKTKGLSLISISQLLTTLQKAIDSPPQKLRVFEINHIKRNSLPAI